MPCRSYEDYNVCEKRSSADVKEINNLTKLLCRATRILAKNKIQMPGQLHEWYEEHLAHDIKRIKRKKQAHKKRLRARLEREREQKERETVLAKLTEREKSLLLKMIEEGKDPSMY